MAEYVEKEATIKRIEEVYCAGCNSYHGIRCRACGTGDAIDMIEDAPAADVAPVVHGRWVDGRCSNCGVDIPTDDAHDVIFGSECRFCYYCGAKMDGGDRDEVD